MINKPFSTRAQHMFEEAFSKSSAFLLSKREQWTSTLWLSKHQLQITMLQFVKNTAARIKSPSFPCY